MNPRLFLPALAAVAALLGGGAARAQPAGPGQYGYQGPPPAPTHPVRDGFVFGASLGGGSYHLECGIACDLFAKERYEGGSFTLHVGGMIGPDSAILFDLWGVGYSPDDTRTLFHNIGTVALRHFVSSKLWLQGGLGWSNFSLSCEDGATDGACGDESKTGGALMLGAGFELLQLTTFALDVGVRFGVGKYDDGNVNMGSVQLGLNWY